ncbi:hypothetical protein DRV84_06465 [Rhodosalinus sediminis]|uniref:Sulfotransferase family protein n=1 Tax=Rhodosalinus sediminis TaxID=1940533 RepID=A0A3D9BWA2_9RHOB|nr:sulfotransferase family 2 domain-containing protein [Rhodosalinus sediminis]REC57810.1 hypothetical protein DRV84_06465 [Rhodosalinus sediminis]
MAVILPQFDLFYAPVPKVACTSLKLLFFSAENGRPFEPFVVNGRTRHIHNAAYATTLHADLPLARLADMHRVAVIRDPVERLISAYRNRVRNHRELARESAPAKFAKTGLDPDPDLGTFVDRLEDYAALSPSIHHHTRPMVDFLGPDPGWFSELYTLAELDRFLADMRARTGQPLTLPHVQTGGPKLDAGALTAAQLRKLRDVYAADYKAFGATLEA